MLTTTAASPGHLNRFVAAKMSPPCVQIQRRPVARVSPWQSCSWRSGRTCRLARSSAKRSTEEVGDESAFAAALLVESHQPIQVALGRTLATDASFRQERRVADERVETRIRSREHLGELDLPVERRERDARVAELRLDERPRQQSSRTSARSVRAGADAASPRASSRDWVSRSFRSFGFSARRTPRRPGRR